MVPVIRMPTEGWSLADSVAQFGWRGSIQPRGDETAYLLCATDEDGLAFAVAIVEDDEGLRLYSDCELSRAAVFQIARMLSVAWPRDDAGFAAAGQRDPVVEGLQARFARVRPIGAASVFEAAVRPVLGIGLPPRIAADLWRRIAVALGDPAPLEGSVLRAFPAPGRLVDPQALAEIRGMNGSRALIVWKRARIAALARAVMDGELDGAMLRGWDGALAVEHLRTATGMTPFEAQSTLIRGAHHPDVFLSAAPPVLQYMQRAYRLQPGDAHGAAQIARVWAPYRSWVSLLMARAQISDDASHADA